MKVFHVDAFTAQPFAGNPAAVCLLDEVRDDRWRQSVAAEMNLPETAFVERRAGQSGFGLRWFTPTTEVELCGHATLAAAHVLWEQGESTARLEFHTRSGMLSAEQSEGGILLDFPADPPREVPAPPGLAEALGTELVWTGRGKFDYLVELSDAEAVRRVAPDLPVLRALPVRGVIVTAVGDGSCDFVSRFFAPASGIDEDHVTGSAHCCLGPYWQARLGRDTLVGYQASARGGYVGVRLGQDRIGLSGHAVTVAAGELLV